MKTKITLLLISTLVGISEVKAQEDADAEPQRKNLLTVSPLGFMNKAKIRYERPVANKISVGIIGAAYYGFYPGFQAVPYTRFYLSDVAPKGLYIQLQAAYYNHHYIDEVTRTDANGTQIIFDMEKSFSGVGGGFGIGYQFLFGNRDHVIVDVMGGFRYYPIRGSENEESDIPDLWYFSGPGSYYNGNIAVGLAF